MTVGAPALLNCRQSREAALSMGSRKPVLCRRDVAGRIQADKDCEMVMTTDGWIVLLGSVGGFCTTFAYVPQVVKIWKQGGRDLSYGMLSLYLFGVLLWLAYGLLLHAQAVVLTNFATAILIALVTALKAWTAKRDEIKEA
jgi:MtN3 and saliva related transmembrane protein